MQAWVMLKPIPLPLGWKWLMWEKQRDLLGTLVSKPDYDFAAVAEDGTEHNMYC